MSKRDRTEAGTYKDPYAFLSKETNLSRQIRRADEREVRSAPIMPVAKPVSAARPKAQPPRLTKAHEGPKIADFLHKPALKPKANKKPATKRVKEPRTPDTKRASKKDLRDRKEYMKRYMANKRARERAKDA